MIELSFLKESILIKQVHQKSVMFVTIGVFFNCCFKFQPNVRNRCHDLLMMSVNLSDITILNIKGYEYCCIIRLISRKETIKLLQNTDLTGNCGTL